MGNEGGTIPKRSEILDYADHKIGANVGSSVGAGASQRQIEKYKKVGKFGRCAMSDQPLAKPIVSDYKGQLYNKEAVIEWLLEKGRARKVSVASHIRSLRDVVELNIQLDEEMHTVRCPVSGENFDLQDPDAEISLVYCVPCGCVMGRRILRESIGVERNRQHKSKGAVVFKCPVCGGDVSSDNVVEINPAESELGPLEERARRLEKLGVSHSLKRQKRKKYHRSRGQSENDKDNGRVRSRRGRNEE